MKAMLIMKKFDGRKKDESKSEAADSAIDRGRGPVGWGVVGFAACADAAHAS